MCCGICWYICYGDISVDIEQFILKYQLVVDDLCNNLFNYLVKLEIKQLEDVIVKWIDKGVLQDIVSRVVVFSNVFSVLDLI